MDKRHRGVCEGGVDDVLAVGRWLNSHLLEFWRWVASRCRSFEGVGATLGFGVMANQAYRLNAPKCTQYMLYLWRWVAIWTGTCVPPHK